LPIFCRRMFMSNWKLILPLTLALVFAFVLELSQPRALNWTPTFAADDKIPLGTYALFKILNEVFPAQSVERRNRPLYNWAGADADYASKTIIFISNQFMPDKLDSYRLLRLTAAGAHVFISAQKFSDQLQDTLHFKTRIHFNVQEAASLSLPAMNSKGTSIHIKSSGLPRFINKFDSTVYSRLLLDSLGKSILIAKNIGKGRIYISCQPFVFANYNFLKNDVADYTADIFRLLPLRPVIWDAYYKTHIEGFQPSPLRYILNDPVLGNIYYLVLLAVFLFVFINGRRRQRSIPVIAPPKNESLDYVITLSGLYRQSNNLLSAARIRRRYVLNFIREHFHLEIKNLDKRFSEALLQKTNLPRVTVFELVRHLRSLERFKQMSRTQFKDLSLWLERFYYELEKDKIERKEQGNGNS